MRGRHWNKTRTSSIPDERNAGHRRNPVAPINRIFLYLLAGNGENSNAFAFRIFRVNNHALYSTDQLKPTVLATLQRLRRLAPATIENGVSGRDARGRRCILASHDADEDADRGSGVSPR
jgi:hypothetical protein